MTDSIRQGGVLSVIEYANLIDEIGKQLQREKKGEMKLWNNSTGCLLLVDDVALIHQDPIELRSMLATTDNSKTIYQFQ